MLPDGTFKLTSATNLRKNCDFYVVYNDMCHYMFKAEFFTLVSVKVSSGCCWLFHTVYVARSTGLLFFLMQV